MQTTDKTIEKNDVMVSVIICTHNRCKSLKDTLDSLIEQDVEQSFKYEILVVDNNSNDGTKSMVCEYIKKFNNKLIYVFESSTGLSIARNTGVNRSKGSIVAFTDDDCILDKKWLSNLVKTFIDFKPDSVGGKILPIWENPKPVWLTKSFYGKLALLDYGEDLFNITDEQKPIFGANFAFKRDSLLKTPLFDTSLGRKGTRLSGGEDTQLVEMIRKNNGIIIYQPSMIVHHKIPQDRMQKKYFVKWSFDSAASQARIESANSQGALQIPAYIFRELFAHLFYFAIYTINNNKKKAFFYKCKSIFFISFLLSKLKLLKTQGALL